jgi:uncharacterized membrane protein (DUF485 family)
MPTPPERGPGSLEALAAKRWRIALVLTVTTMVVYFGFILLIAFDKPLMGTILRPGLSVGIALGAAVIVAAWVLTGVYVRWANEHYDAAAERHHRTEGDER